MSVVVLNASYEPHQVVSFKHAIKMLARQVAVVHEAAEGPSLGPFPRPRVLRLVRYVYVRWHTGAWPKHFSKKALHRRDDWTCAYCLGYGDTVEHIVPKSRGGPTDWINCVTACRDCNSQKDGLTPEEAGMPVLLRTYDPSDRPRHRP